MAVTWHEVQNPKFTDVEIGDRLTVSKPMHGSEAYFTGIVWALDIMRARSTEDGNVTDWVTGIFFDGDGDFWKLQDDGFNHIEKLEEPDGEE